MLIIVKMRIVMMIVFAMLDDAYDGDSAIFHMCHSHSHAPCGSQNVPFSCSIICGLAVSLSLALLQ